MRLDPGGPSNLVVNQKTGQVYVVFGTRSSIVGGGCGASITGTLRGQRDGGHPGLGGDRVGLSGTADPTGWTQSKAVDATTAGHIVGMQLSPGAVDTAGNVYVFFPESPNTYPDYDGAAMKYVHAPGDLSLWSAPVTVAPAGGAGHVLPHIVAGDPRAVLDFAYFTGRQPGHRRAALVLGHRPDP